MFYTFCLALLVTLASASVNELQSRPQWDMLENRRQNPSSIVYDLPNSKTSKFQTKNVNRICIYFKSMNTNLFR